MEKKTTDTVVIIPAYNEEKTIGEVVKAVIKNGYKPLVINDGSTDNTSEVASKAKATVVFHFENYGKGEALQTAMTLLKNFDFKNYIIIDGDLQYNPKEIKKIVRALQSFDYVVGMRDWSKVPLRHRFGNWVWVRLFHFLFGTNLDDISCGFVGMTREVAHDLKFSGGYVIESYMLHQVLKKGYSIGNCSVSVRYHKKSGVIRGIRMVLGISIFMFKMKLGIIE